MAISLTTTDQEMLDGLHGEASRLAMSVVARMADVLEATELMNVTQAHIDACGLLSDAGLEFAETLAAGGGKVRVPTTLNMGPLDLQDWRKFDVPQQFAAKAIRQGRAYEQMGCIPTWTCAPYQGYLTPRFGQQICWGESNAVVYANSVLGARTNWYGDYFDICAAITGRVPKQGLHLTENRKGQLLLRLVDVPPQVFDDDRFWPTFGHLLGSVAGDQIPVIEGLPDWATDDQLKALGAAAASSGAVALFHGVGLTPEAPTTEAAFQGDKPKRVVDISVDDLCNSYADLSTGTDGDRLDAVVLGCPHYSFAEFRRLAELLEAQEPQSLHPDVAFVVITGQQSYSLLERTELLDKLASFGVKISRDTCVLHCPIVPAEAKVIMTDSGKCAYYAPGDLNVDVSFGSMADCVRSAVEGRVCREELPWQSV